MIHMFRIHKDIYMPWSSASRGATATASGRQKTRNQTNAISVDLQAIYSLVLSYLKEGELNYTRKGNNNLIYKCDQCGRVPKEEQYIK